MGKRPGATTPVFGAHIMRGVNIQHLKTWMNIRGFSAKRLAESVGVSANSIYAWMEGKHSPQSMVDVARIALALRVNIYALLK